MTAQTATVIKMPTTRAQFRNERDLKRFVKNHIGASPADLVRAIDMKARLAEFTRVESHHHRLEAGEMYLELRRQIEAGGENWWQWHKQHFARKKKDAMKLMAMARADDPEAAAADERARARKGMARFRDKVANVSDHPTVAYIMKLIGKLADEQRAELFGKLREVYRGQGFDH